jgi:hypothetical protein
LNNRVDLNPQGVVAVLSRGTLFFIPTTTEADAQAMAAVIGTLGKNIATPAYGKWNDRHSIAMNITDDLNHTGPLPL